MRLLICLLSILPIVLAGSYLKLTPEEYKAFQVALRGRKPVLLQSALPIFSLKNIRDDKYLYVDIGGDSAKTPKFHAPSSNRVFTPQRMSPSGVPHPKLNKVKGLRGIKKGVPPGFPSSRNIFFLSGNSAPRVQKNRLQPSRKKTSQNRRKDNILLPIYRDEVDDLMPISKRRGRSLLKDVIIRRRRDANDTKSDHYKSKDAEEEEEEEQVRYVEELSFGLSTAGGVLGGAVGGYLDTTGAATMKLIRTVENLGLIAVGQLDDFLDQQEEEKRGRNSY